MLSYPNIDPVAISIGPIDVHWYGLMYLFGFAGAWALAVYRIRMRPQVVTAKQVEDLTFYAALGVVLGGRIGYVFFYSLEEWSRDWMLILRLWEGGMSFHGGLIGTALALMIYARRTGKNFFDIVDFVAVFAPIGLFFGRIGNFIGGELYGRATDVPWAMVFPSDPEALARHPSQLYQAFFEGLVLFSVLFWFTRKPRPRCAVIGLFMLLYGLFRFMVEFVRQPDAHIMFDLFGWMTRGQLLSIPMMAVGGALLLWTYSKTPTPPVFVHETDKKNAGNSSKSERKKK